MFFFAIKFCVISIIRVLIIAPFINAYIIQSKCTHVCKMHYPRPHHPRSEIEIHGAFLCVLCYAGVLTTTYVMCVGTCSYRETDRQTYVRTYCYAILVPQFSLYEFPPSPARHPTSECLISMNVQITSEFVSTYVSLILPYPVRMDLR